MAQSFLNMSGYPLGLRNNNPGNLRPLSSGTWLGEIAPDYVNNFSRFQNVAYGLRAMITDITGDIVKDGQNTLRKLITAYAPPGENDTAAYIATVSSLTGLAPDQIIPVSHYWISKIIVAKMIVELGQYYAAKVSGADISEAFDMLSDQVKSWLNYSPGAGIPVPLIIGAAILTIYLLNR